MRRLKENPILLVSSIVSLVIGLWLITADSNRIINSIYFIIGGGLIITGISKIITMKYSNDKSFVYDGLVNIVIGLLIMYVHNWIITIILGLLFIGFPLYRIFKSIDKKEQFKRELPLIIIGLVIALSGDIIANIFIKILGGLFVLLSIYLFINIFTDKIAIYRFKKVGNSTRDKSSGNVIDVEYVESESDE